MAKLHLLLAVWYYVSAGLFLNKLKIYINMWYTINREKERLQNYCFNMEEMSLVKEALAMAEANFNNLHKGLVATAYIESADKKVETTQKKDIDYFQHKASAFAKLNHKLTSTSIRVYIPSKEEDY